MLAPVCFASRVHSTSIGKFFPRNHLKGINAEVFGVAGEAESCLFEDFGREIVECSGG
jgi:hypothetical protein